MPVDIPDFEIENTTIRETPLEYEYHTIFGGRGTIRVIGEADENHPTNISILREQPTPIGAVGVTFKINDDEFCAVKDSDADITVRRMCGKIVVHIKHEELDYE